MKSVASPNAFGIGSKFRFICDSFEKVDRQKVGRLNRKKSTEKERKMP